MEINTQFGTQEIDPETIITLPEGMAGFPDLTRYKLFHEADKPTVFRLQAVDDEAIRFPVTDPQLLNVAYEVTLNDAEEQILQLDSSEDLSLLVTLARASDDQSPIHANLLAPVLINTAKRLGLQKSLNQVESAVIIRAN